jgi:hypothetical protein
MFSRHPSCHRQGNREGGMCIQSTLGVLIHLVVAMAYMHLVVETCYGCMPVLQDLRGQHMAPGMLYGLCMLLHLHTVTENLD